MNFLTKIQLMKGSQFMRINIDLHPFDSIRFIKCPRNPELVERTDIWIDHRWIRNENRFSEDFNCYYNHGSYIPHVIGTDDIYEVTMTHEEKFIAQKNANKLKNSELRQRIFALLGTEDDGRYEPLMTKEEFEAFSKNKKINYIYKQSFQEIKNQSVLVYLKFAPYSDDSYYYNEKTQEFFVVLDPIGD